MDWKNGILFIAALVVVAVFLIQKWDWVISRFGIISKRRLAQEKLEKDVNELKDHAKNTDENIERIIHSIDELQECIHGVSDQVSGLQKKNDLNEAARLKDRISQGYRYFHQKGQWTSMEKESMEEMIRAYSQYSENSFVHSIVERDMPTWTVIDE